MNTTSATPRASDGRFQPGNPGGPGNPFARQVAQLRKALLNSVTEQDIQEVAQALIARAKEGNTAAAKLLLSYTIGKPDAAPHPDRMDVDEWNGYRETATMKTEAASLAQAGAPESHLAIVRTLRPLVAELAHAQMCQVVEEEMKPKQSPPKAEPEEVGFDMSEEGMRYTQEILDEAARHWEARKAASVAAPAPPTSPSGSIREARPSANGSILDREPSTNGHFHRNGFTSEPEA